jgi:hypothetical protein
LTTALANGNRNPKTKNYPNTKNTAPKTRNYQANNNQAKSVNQSRYANAAAGNHENYGNGYNHQESGASNEEDQYEE